MAEKPPLRPLVEDSGGDNFVHPTAPPSYDQAMVGGSQGNQSLNNPINPYQGHIGLVMPNTSVPQQIPQGMPVYPNLQGNVPHPAVPQPTPYGAYPNQMAYVPGQPPPATVNIAVPAVQVTRVVPVGPKGMRMRCFHCGADIKSTTVTSFKASAHLACLILCIFFCCICSWIPYCMSSCKKVDHKCPNCKAHLGSYE